MRSFRNISSLLLLLTVSLSAQEAAEPRHLGLSYTLQSGQSVIHMPIVMSESFVLAPSLGAYYRQQQGTDVIIGVEPRFLLKSGPVTPYIGVGLTAFLAFPDAGLSSTDLMLRGVYGGEYSFDRHFSIGGDVGLQAIKSSTHSLRFGNPDRFIVQTDATLYVTFYF